MGRVSSTRALLVLAFVAAGLVPASLPLSAAPSGAPAAPVSSARAALAAATSLLDRSDDARGALALLDAALASPSLTAAEAHDALLLRAGLLVRMRRFPEALAVLDGPAPRGLAGDPLDPDLRLLRAKALHGLGRRADAETEVARAAARFASDSRFPRLFYERLQGLPASQAERDLAALFERRLPRLAETDPELWLLAVPTLFGEAERRDAIRAYRALGLSSPPSTLLALEYGLIDDGTAVSEFFALRDAFSRAELELLRDLLRSEPGHAAFRSALAAFAGRVVEDADSDGWPETLAVFEGGSLVSWARDLDQDGRAEYLIECQQGCPRTARLSLAGADASLVWGEWPELSSLATGAETFRFAPGAWSWSPLVLEAFPAPTDPVILLPRSAEVALPTRAAALPRALEVEVRLDGGLLERTSLDAGLPLRRELLDGGRVVAVTDYEGGRPTQELRDADRDGRFETLALWDPVKPGSASLATPEPSTVRVDTDGDGIRDYREDSGFPYLREWDLDGDGLMDIRQSSLSDGALRREFSSRLDGNYDESVDIEASGRVGAFSRDGRPVNLLSDSNPRLRWLGKKPFDLGTSMPTEDGLYVSGRFRYRLMSAGASYFAELIE